MIKKLLLIRHSEAEHLVDESLTGGWTDSILTDNGRVQAHRTANVILKLLTGVDFDFYSSDLLRAKETAEIIGMQVNKTPELYYNLRELNNGNAANLSRQNAEKILNPKTEPNIEWIPYPNAESWKMMNDRVKIIMDELNVKSKETVLIVSHGNTIVSIIHWWLELNEQYISKVSFDIEPCSITQLRINDWGEKVIVKLNDTAHLLA